MGGLGAVGGDDSISIMGNGEALATMNRYLQMHSPSMSDLSHGVNADARTRWAVQQASGGASCEAKGANSGDSSSGGKSCKPSPLNAVSRVKLSNLRLPSNRWDFYSLAKGRGSIWTSMKERDAEQREKWACWPHYTGGAPLGGSPETKGGTPGAAETSGKSGEPTKYKSGEQGEWRSRVVLGVEIDDTMEVPLEELKDTWRSVNQRMTLEDRRRAIEERISGWKYGKDGGKYGGNSGDSGKHSQNLQSPIRDDWRRDYFSASPSSKTFSYHVLNVRHRASHHLFVKHASRQPTGGGGSDLIPGFGNARSDLVMEHEDRNGRDKKNSSQMMEIEDIQYPYKVGMSRSITGPGHSRFAMYQLLQSSPAFNSDVEIPEGLGAGGSSVITAEGEGGEGNGGGNGGGADGGAGKTTPVVVEASDPRVRRKRINGPIKDESQNSGHQKFRQNRLRTRSYGDFLADRSPETGK